MPPLNTGRRTAIADAAIEVLGERGVHGLSHRAVDQRAGLPSGTTSNYFRSRDSLLVAAAERVVALHASDMERANGQVPAPSETGQLIELIAKSLYVSATQHRTRYRAIYELTLEASRNESLSRTLTGLSASLAEFTAHQHVALGLETSPEQVNTLITLFSGALFTLVAVPSSPVDLESARSLARAMVSGVGLVESP